MTDQKKPKPKCQVKLDILGRIYEGESRTIKGAIAKLPLTWQTVKGKGVITVTKEGHVYERNMRADEIRRMVANDLSRRLWADRFDFLTKTDSTKQ